MKIRKLSVDDYEEIYELWLSTPGMGLNNIDDSKTGVEKYLKRNPTTCFVAETSGKIVGTILAGHDGKRAFIYHLSVSVDKRNEGIGSALLDAAVEALRQEGVSKVALVVFAKNEIGNAFWEHEGFHAREDLVYREMTLLELQKIRP
jgi:ribosomal protein S18 acetylase RimI-like enzyme